MFQFHFYYEPHDSQATSANTSNRFHFWDIELFKIKDNDTADKIRKAFYAYFNDGLYAEKYKAFLETQHKLEEKTRDFENAIRLISDKISLGHNMLSICDTCVTFLPLGVSKQYHYRVKPHLRKLNRRNR